MKFYELFPKLDQYNNILDILGHTFELIYRREDKLRFFARTSAETDVLRKYFGVKEAEINDRLPLRAQVFFKKEKDFYWGAEFNDFTNFLTKLKNGEEIRIWIVLEPRLNDIFLKRSDKLKRNQSAIGRRQREVLASRLESFAKDNIYYVQIQLVADKGRLKELGRELSNYILTNSRKLKLAIEKNKEDKMPRVPRFHSLYYKKWIWADQNVINKIAVIPSPTILPVDFAIGGLLPDLPPNRQGFRIGKLTYSGKEVQLELEDFFRHSYIIGGTGAGKTSSMRMILKRLKEAYPDIVEIIIDPHGDFAEEMVSFYSSYTNKFNPDEQLFYFHPIEAPVSINPLALPKLPNVEQAVLLGFSNVMEIFEKLFMLKESAVYVKYVIQNSLSILYQKTPEPTFYDLYKVIISLRNGTLDLPIKSKDWEEKLEMFQDLDDTTFVSALSRIEMLSTNPLLRKIFSTSKIPDDTLFRKGNVIVINASKGAVGDEVSFLIMAGWLFKIWYYALARAQLRMERIPIIVAIDEFQNVADLSLIDTILAEARKYSLHLLLAHQHTGQIDMNLLKSLMSNTGVKILMKMQGSDAEKFAEIFPEFRNELLKVLPAQSVGQCVLIITPRKPGDKTVPVQVNLDFEELTRDQNKLQRVIERMRQFTAEKIEEKDIINLVNPLFKYIDRPNVLEQVILYRVYKSFTDHAKHSIYLVDLLKQLGIDRDKVENIINRMDRAGYVSVEKVGNKKLLQYGKGLFGNVKMVAPGEEGRKLAMKVMLRYMKKNYYVVPSKQTPDLTSRPDLVAMPYDVSNYTLDYEKAVAVEIESCNELETHPEQVVRNWRKPSTNDFSEIHTWTLEECFNKLQELYNQLSDEEKKKVKIFALKVRKNAAEKQQSNTMREENRKTEKQKTEESSVYSPVNQNFQNNRDREGHFSQQSENKEEQEMQQNMVYSPVKEDRVSQQSEKTASKQEEMHENRKSEEKTQEETITIKGVVIKILNGNIIEINGKKYQVLESDIDLLKKSKNIAESITVNDNEIVLKVLNYKKTILLKEITS
ncbi:DUF87 domain-containing protein [Sulfolobus tengchongensis]|uniref:DUF87 domain-containing protein n=1 Tax=Sulfolobus tengchongensis TaxID=207809 RepID=A0AAX4L017_9CREN